VSVYKTLDFEAADMATYAAANGLTVTGSPTLAASPFYETAKSMSCTDAGYTNTYISFTSNKARVYASGFIYVSTAPPDGPRMLFGAYDINGTDSFFRINTARTVTIRVGGVDRATTTTALSLNTWNHIWFSQYANGASSLYEFRVGSELISYAGTVTAGNQNTSYIGIDNNAGAATINFDYFVFDDATYPSPYVPPSTMIKQNNIRPRRYAPGNAR
jgi:hypothetical protein